jgi:hypothetical protein
MVGDCGLCHTKGVTLKDSHLIPRALYKLFRDERFPDPSPVLISEGKSLLSNRQAADCFLCDVCEDRFNKYGEAWVLANCWRDEQTFKLRDALLATRPHPKSSSDTKIFVSAAAPGVEPDKLAYFAASVFWRRAARSWEIGTLAVRRLRFDRYEEAFRLYLLGRARWPRDAVMFINVSAGMETMRNAVVEFPARISRNGSYIYRLRIPGITFMLMLGSRFRQYVNLCAVHNVERPIYMAEDLDKWNFKDVMREYANSPRVGKLTQRTQGPAVAPPNWSDEDIRRLLPPKRKK